jgi:NlpC/P60 family putative phage cell wall peptidase
MSVSIPEVLAEARTWLGTPWRHASDVKGAGVDCIMLLRAVFNAAGMSIADPRPYPPDWYLHRGEERCLDGVMTYADEVTDPRPGDVALYKVYRCYAHAALVLDWPEVLHAFRGEGVVLAQGNQGFLADRAVRFFRVRGL